jgi:hypothetical protein
VFYALHHLYLTRFAAYVVIFNMEVRVLIEIYVPRYTSASVDAPASRYWRISSQESVDSVTTRINLKLFRGCTVRNSLQNTNMTDYETDLQDRGS